MLTLGRAHVALCSLALLGACTGELRQRRRERCGRSVRHRRQRDGRRRGQVRQGWFEHGRQRRFGHRRQFGKCGGSVEDLCAQNMGVLSVGRTRLRRLTRAQVNNTLRDLVGVTGNPASAIAPDEQIGPFLLERDRSRHRPHRAATSRGREERRDERRFAHESARSLRSRRR